MKKVKLFSGVLVSLIIATGAFAASYTWDGNVADWLTNSEWTPDQVPNISAGTDTATINAGTVTYVPGGDWANNSTVTINNSAAWIQATNGGWLRMAGSGSGKIGFIVLNDNATFNAGTASRAIIGVDAGTGTVQLNNSASFTAGNAAEVIIGRADGTGTVQVNDDAIFDTDGVNMYIAFDDNCSGTLDINGGTVTVGGELWFSYIGDDSFGNDTYGRVNISGGVLEVVASANSILFWNIDATSYDHAINFDGSGGSIITHGALNTEFDGTRTSKTWEELFDAGFLLRNGSNSGSFSDYFAVKDLGGGERELILRNVVWGGTDAEWLTAANWVQDVVPVISDGTHDATINGGTVTYVAGADWKNNSTVTINNSGAWIQSGGGAWLRIAGDGSGQTGLLELNNNASFNAGTAGVIILGINDGTGTVRLNDDAVLDTNGKPLIIAFDNNSSGTLDINGGTVTVGGELWITDVNHTADDEPKGSNTYSRINISDGTLELKVTGTCIWFWNAGATDYDHAFNFDGANAGATIITRGAIKYKANAVVTAAKSWAELYADGKLLRNGSNSGSFSNIFAVTNLGDGDRELSILRKGTIIFIQ